MGPDERGKLALVAHKFYKQGLPQTAIARDMGVSRFKVARMLERAVDEGIVRIDISLPGNINAELSVELAERFGLQNALVVTPEDGSDAALYSALGRCAADLLAETVETDDVLGVASGRTLIAMAGYVRGLRACEVVQLSGLVGNHAENAAEVIRRMVGRSGGQAHTLYAPILVRDSATAVALRAEPTLTGTFTRMGEVTKAVIAIGSWQPADSQMFLATEPETRDRLVRDGVRAEVCTTPIDVDGKPVEDLADRVIGMDFSTLLKVPEIIAVAGGKRKHSAIQAVLAGDFVTTLVTDAETARFLLNSVRS